MPLTIKEALIANAKGRIALAKANVQVYLSNSVGIGGHSNIMESIQEQLEVISKYQGQIDVLNTDFYEED